MKVFLGSGEHRRIVDVPVVKETESKVWVKLADGNVITRKKRRDVPTPEQVNAEAKRAVESGLGVLKVPQEV